MNVRALPAIPTPSSLATRKADALCRYNRKGQGGGGGLKAKLHPKQGVRFLCLKHDMDLTILKVK